MNDRLVRCEAAEERSGSKRSDPCTTLALVLFAVACGGSIATGRSQQRRVSVGLGNAQDVVFDLPRRGRVYVESAANVINIVGHYVCDLNAFKGSCSFVILPETT